MKWTAHWQRLCLSLRLREKQAECITSLKRHSSVSGCEDRGLLSIAGDEKQVCVCVCACWCVAAPQGRTLGACWDLHSEVPLLQAIKQAITSLLSLKKKRKEKQV